MSYFHEFLRSPMVMSGYLGSNPYGGKYCSRLESEWKAKFKCKHAVAVNSATSGLLASCMAINVRSGDEVIVSPYTMSATAAAPAVLGATIVFCDIDEETLTLNPREVEKAITKSTKAVIVTNLFGCPAHLQELRQICDDRNIWLIEDNAQAILAREFNEYTGTVGHMGVFSLNVHKHIQTGEGGVVVTDDPELDKHLRGAMNHGEMRGLHAGLNLRMTEITAALAMDQLKEVENEVAKAQTIASVITNLLVRRGAVVLQGGHGDNHSYYCLPFMPDDRDTLLRIGAKPYVEPLYRLPAFDSFRKFCPIAEWAYDHVLVFELCHNPQIGHIITQLESYRDGKRDGRGSQQTI